MINGTGNKDYKKLKVKLTKIVTGVLSAFLVFVLVAGLVLVVFYKSGEASLKASASAKTPTVDISEDEQETVDNTKQDYLYGNAIAWQDDWVAYNDKVYSYNEGTLNFVLMGIDRSGEISSEENFTNWKAGQADAIFLLSLNPNEKTVSVIGIPRNSMVNLDIYNEDKEIVDQIYNQICLQYPYAGGGEFGLSKMEESVSELFYDLPIQGACAISFNAIEVIVDMLGGIEVTIPDDMTKMNSSYVQGSTITLTKGNVLEYLRYRDRDSVGSPTTRLAREKEFMQAAINVAIEKVKKNPMIVSDIYQAVAPYMNTDIELDEVVYLAKQSLDYSITSDSFYQLTGENKQYFINEEDYYEDYYLDKDALKKVFMEVFYTPVVLSKAQ